jgi:NAD(P)H dehydrogenase (quinone)
MRVVVVVADPDPAGYPRAIAEVARVSLIAAGHDVTVLDLHAEGFRAAMSHSERTAYHGERPLLDPMVERQARLVQDTEALVFVYPTRFSMMPAILKGWLERTLVPGVGFVFDERNRVRPGLTNVRRIIGISTYSAPWWQVKLTNDNGRRILHRALRLNTGLVTRRSWLGLYRVDSRTDEQRAEFLRRVERKLGAL